MRLPCLRFLLVDCNGILSRDWFYIIACFVSFLTVTNSTAALLNFCLDYFSGAPVYHGLPHVGSIMLYLVCILCTLALGIPPLLFSIMAMQGVQPEQPTLAGKLCRMAKIENFHSQRSITQYMLLTTISSAGIIFFNTLSVAALYYGLRSLFHKHWSDRINSIDILQRYYSCCGLEDFSDWAKSAGQLPISCNATSAIVTRSVIEKAVMNSLVYKQPSNHSAGEVVVHKNGCSTPMTSEQAAICGIGNMLAFAGILLLLAVWTRLESGSADITSAAFSHPHHIGDDDSAFVVQQQKRLASLYKVQSPMESSQAKMAGHYTSDSSSGAKRLRETQQFISKGYLYQEEREKYIAHASNGSSESDLADGYRFNHNKGYNSSNNNALVASGHWMTAQVFNSIETQLEYRQAWKRNARLRNSCQDSVRVINEYGSSKTVEQLLNARGLCDSTVATSVVHCRSVATGKLVVGCVTQGPLLLEDFLSESGSQRIRPEPFKTTSSGRLALDWS